MRDGQITEDLRPESIGKERQARRGDSGGSQISLRSY